MLWKFLIRNSENVDVAEMTYDWDKDEYHATIYPFCDESTEVPLIMHFMIEDGKYEVDDKICRDMISDRVVPANRQNIGLALRAFNLPYYHEAFMLKNMPKSEMDDCTFNFVEEVNTSEK